MPDPSIDAPKWASVELMPLPARFNSAVRSLVAQRVEDAGRPWAEVVFDHELELFGREDAERIEADTLATGYRFAFSATVSFESEPDKYKRADQPETEAADRAEVIDGRRLVGSGDNVIRKTMPLSGTVALISDIDEVMRYLTDGIPDGTIAVIDDSGGTLTAPILESFSGVICLGGTVRSHLGILAREYDVPTLMNCTLEPLQNGDRVELEVTAAPPPANAYEVGDTGHARIWKIEGDV